MSLLNFVYVDFGIRQVYFCEIRLTNLSPYRFFFVSYIGQLSSFDNRKYIPQFFSKYFNIF